MYQKVKLIVVHILIPEAIIKPTASQKFLEVPNLIHGVELQSGTYISSDKQNGFKGSKYLKFIYGECKGRSQLHLLKHFKESFLDITFRLMMLCMVCVWVLESSF